MCTEDSPSGLWRTLGKRVGCKPSGVRIPHPPPPDPGTALGSGVFFLFPTKSLHRRGGLFSQRIPSVGPRCPLTSTLSWGVAPTNPVCSPFQGDWSRVWEVRSLNESRLLAPVRERSAKLGRQLGRTHPGFRRCWSARQVVAWTASLGRSDARAVGWRSDWAVLRVSRPRSLRLRGPPRSPHPAEPREARPSRRASSGAGPSRCNSTPSHTPSR